MTQVSQKKESPKEALKNAIAEAVSKPAKKAVESPKKIAADAIASIISPFKEALPATLAVTPVIPVSGSSPAPVKKQEVAPANPVAAVQKVIQKDDKKQDPSKDVPKRKSHWFMSILHSIGNFFSSLFSWGSSSKK